MEPDAVKTAFCRALGLPREERDLFLGVCGHGLREEVEGLLELHERAGGFMRTPLPEVFGAVAPPATCLSPEILVRGRYRIGEILSTSSFATVYCAVDEALAQKPVVVKVLDRVYRNSVRRAMLTSEIGALVRLRHSGIVAISDAGELDDSTPFLVLDFVPGNTLREELRIGPLSPDRAKALLIQLLHAISAAHDLGILHLDLKPENIILSRSDNGSEKATLVDFGIARIRGLEDPGPQGGSPLYMAPEQEREATVRSDLYSLGRVAFEMLRGQLPAPHLPVLKQLPFTLDSRLAGVVAAMIEAEPARRPASAARILAALERRDRAVTWRNWIGAAMTVTLCGIALYALVHREEMEPPLTPMPLVTSPGFDSRPAFSPDGKFVYYVSGAAGTRQIFRKSINGGDPVRVSHGNSDDDLPAVAPSGKQLAILRGYPLAAAIVVMEPDGSGETELARARSFDSVIWTPDGRGLLVGTARTSEAPRRLALLDIARQTWRNALPTLPRDQDFSRAAYSPDGKRLAFVRAGPGGASELLVAKTDSGFAVEEEPKLVARSPAGIEQLAWPDSRSLIYVAGPVGGGSVWRVPSEGGKATRILPAAGRIGSVAVDRGAGNLTYSVNLSDTNIWQLDLRTGRQTLVIAQSYDDEEAHLSPDGRWLAFVSSRTGEEQAWLARADGSAQRRISDFRLTDAVDVVWTADSASLLVSVRSKTLGLRTYRKPVEGTSLEEVTADGMAVSVSRDGRSVYFRRRPNGRAWQIWRMDPARPAEARQVAVEGAWYAVESPDGRELYFAMRDESEGIRKTSLPDGEATTIVPRLFRRNLFVPGAHGLYFVGPGADEGRPVLFVRRYRDGRTLRLHTFDNPLFWGLDLTHDEQRVLFSQYDTGNSDIMLVNGFR